MATLIIGYGNPYREDDGVGFHVLGLVARELGREPLAPDDDGIEDLGHEVDLVCMLQLLPELAEIVAGYDRVCFIDAHATDFDEEIRWIELKPSYNPSSFTHHLTPETLLSLASLYGGRPEGVLVSIKGYSFNFRDSLSEQTARLAQSAAARVVEWLSA